MIEIFTIIYNEEVILQKFINHYRERFPNCEITIYDNMSTDNSRQIAIKNGCKIIDYDSNNQIRDDLYLEIKNNCWKNANTDWVLIVDTDEFIYINEQQLKNEESLGKTIISFEGWNLITMSDNPDIIDLDLKCGSRAAQYDKSYLFNKRNGTRKHKFAFYVDDKKFFFLLLLLLSLYFFLEIYSQLHV